MASFMPVLFILMESIFCGRGGWMVFFAVGEVNMCGFDIFIYSSNSIALSNHLNMVPLI